MKYTLFLKQSFPFASNPVSAELESDHIICNDVNLPEHIEHTFNPHGVKLWVIGHQFGAICAIFASCEQDALDAAVDANRLDYFMVENQDYEDETLTPLGNASELFDLSDCWMAPVVFDAVRDIALIVKLSRAAESGADTLDF